MENNNIGEVYKKAFEDFEVSPSTETWTKIEKSLKKKSFFQQYKLPLFSLAGAILLLSTFFIIRPNSTEQIIEPIQETAKNIMPEKSPIVVDSVKNDDSISVINEENIQLAENKKILNNSPKESKTEQNNNIPNTESSVSSPSKEEFKLQKIENSIVELTSQKESITTNKIDTIPIFDDEVLESITAATVSVSHEEYTTDDVLMPNAISLSNNDYFKPINTCENCHSFEMVIYSKQGETIFRTKDIDMGWNGSAKGNLVKTDTYVYVLSYKKGNENKVKKGYVVVVP
ncbi:gliding motility-associated C-terminal domain-containing protein [Bacteroidales bacterium OttesenSCG-928-C19]|nr:gliding motility-associated C-terminal domain-containing protein [Bacteroidales bacterium OttesenSCG-928-C19]